MFKILSTVFCILTTSFLVGSHPSPGEWSLTGQYLYLQPLVDDTYFVIESLPNPPSDPSSSIILNGEERSNQFNYASAYRIGLQYAFCECDREFGVYYTNLDTSHRKTILGNALTPSIGIENFALDMAEYEGKATSKISVDYKSLDVLFGQKIYQCCGFDFRVLLGLEFAKLHFHQNIDYLPMSADTSSSLVNERSHTRGVGPKIGFDFDYRLCQNWSCLPGVLNLNLFSTGSLLVSRCNTKTNIAYEFDGVDSSYNLVLRKSTRIIPAFHMGVGLNYNFCGSCYVIDLGLGYEFSAYFKSLLVVKNDSYYGSTLTDVRYSDFDAQGLFVSLSVQF